MKTYCVPQCHWDWVMAGRERVLRCRFCKKFKEMTEYDWALSKRVITSP